jgi:hypothetical protein
LGIIVFCPGKRTSPGDRRPNATFAVADGDEMFHWLATIRSAEFRPMGWNRDNVTADDVGARRAVNTRRRSHRLALLTFTAFLVSATVAGVTAHAGTTGTELSDQQRAVSAIAIQNGDRRFLMLDKSRGELLLFVDGQPVFQGAALVGESRADEIPPYLFNKPFSVPAKLAEKVTPAGLYTVRREADPHYGTIFTINEIKGTDWDITIHRIAIVPGERRPERIRSPDAAGRHITNGCINVERETIGFLERNVTGPRTSLYILPEDPGRIPVLFGRRPVAAVSSR